MTTVPSKIAPGERLRARLAWKALAAHYRHVRKFHLRSGLSNEAGAVRRMYRSGT
jgi:hypothetical protein